MQKGVDWVVVGEPEVQRQREKWVVRQGGYDPATGRRKVRQLGSQRLLPSAHAAERGMHDTQHPQANRGQDAALRVGIERRVEVAHDGPSGR